MCVVWVGYQIVPAQGRKGRKRGERNGQREQKYSVRVMFRPFLRIAIKTRRETSELSFGWSIMSLACKSSSAGGCTVRPPKAQLPATTSLASVRKLAPGSNRFKKDPGWNLTTQGRISLRGFPWQNPIPVRGIPTKCPESRLRAIPDQIILKETDEIPFYQKRPISAFSRIGNDIDNPPEVFATCKGLRSEPESHRQFVSADRESGEFPAPRHSKAGRIL
jgi:hypothetical protein